MRPAANPGANPNPAPPEERRVLEVLQVLKQDALGRVELVRVDEGLAVRRLAVGGRLPGSPWLARVLLARERRALETLEGTSGVARVLHAPRDGASLLRSFVPGTPLCQAHELPRDFFERLEELVRALHARGVCHNDLHKEANVLVGEDGFPALVDFQLASRHACGGRTFAVRAREDLRHVWKHRSLYLRASGQEDPLPVPPPRSFLAESWRRFGKPLYRALVQNRLPSGEPRRAPGGAWPRWSAPTGARLTSAGSSPGAPSRTR